MMSKKGTYKKSEIDRERASKRAIQNNRKQKQAFSSYLGDDENYGSFSNQLAQLGLKLRDIPGDGNCLFRALGDQLDGDSNNHLHHREETVRYMVANKSDFEPFVEDDVPFGRHIENLQSPGTYAGNDAIVAFARKNNVNVVIHQLNAPIWTIKGCESPNARQLHIAYHNGDHYSSIRKLADNSKKPTNIKLSVDLKESEKTQRHRSSRKHSDVSSGELKKAKSISMITGCQDLSLVKKILRETGYDESRTIGLILESIEPDEEDGNESVSSSDSSHGDRNVIGSIWDAHGTGTRLFGNHSIESASNSTKPRSPHTNVPTKKLSNKKRQEQARRDRKKRNEMRKRNTPPSDSDESEILVKNLSVLNI